MSDKKMKLTTGQTIRIVRMQQGIKQGALEKAVGVSQGKLSRVEIADEDLKVTTLIAICKELKTSPTEFFQIKEGV